MKKSELATMIENVRRDNAGYLGDPPPRPCDQIDTLCTIIAALIARLPDEPTTPADPLAPPFGFTRHTLHGGPWDGTVVVIADTLNSVSIPDTTLLSTLLDPDMLTSLYVRDAAGKFVFQPKATDFEAEPGRLTTGRGTLLTGPYPFDAKTHWMNQTIRAQGRLWTITGIEYWGGNGQPAKGDIVGFVVVKRLTL